MLIQLTGAMESCKACDVEIMDRDVNYRNRNGIAICDDCHGDKYYYCDYCGVSVFPEYYNGEVGECTRCVNERYYSCTDCGYLVHGDWSYYSEYDDNVRCESCHDEHVMEYDSADRIEGVSEYHSGAYWGLVFHDVEGYSDSPQHSTYYGVELECEGIDGGISETLETMMYDRIGHAERDGSLDNGIEFITQPATLEAWRNEFGNAIYGYMDTAKSHGANFGHNTCGAHVHVSRTAFTSDSHLMRFVTFMRHNEQFIEAISGRSNIDRWSKVNQYGKGELAREVKRKSGDRYRAVNLNNAATVEIRAFAGSNSFTDILGSVESLIKYTADLTISDINIGALLADSFIAWLTDSDLSDHDHARNLVANRYGSN
jgi:hypothetical protein